MGTQGASHAWSERPEYLGYQVQGEMARDEGGVPRELTWSPLTRLAENETS